MTVCIAAICEGGGKVVTATDGLVTLGDITGEAIAGKMYWFGDWQFLYAGFPSHVSQVLERFRCMLAEDPGTLARERIQDAVHEAYLSFVVDKSSTAVLAPFGITLNDFYNSGRAKLGDATFNRLYDRIDQRSNELNDQLLVIGWGQSKCGPMIFEVSGRGDVDCHELVGMTAIGSGSHIALSHLLGLGQSRSSGLAETVYRVAAAKFMAEKSEDQSVGVETTMHISWRRADEDSSAWPPGIFLEPQHIEQLRNDWGRYGKSGIPDQALMSTASIAGKLGLPSLHDMISAVGAAARIHNRPEGMAWNSEDGGPP